MDKEVLYVKGPSKIAGEVEISKAKNAILPILASTVMVKNPVVINQVPALLDVTSMLTLLGQMGVDVTVSQDMSIELDATKLFRLKAPTDLVQEMRASCLVLGPMLSRFGYAEVAMPGGCAIGTRPIDMHLDGFRKMGATIKYRNGYVVARCRAGRLKGADIKLQQVTVTGTENLMMAAVLAEGRTTIMNAAKEPEVIDLALFLNTVGANIHGAGTDTIIVDGVEQLSSGSHHVLFDRIEAGTYLIAAAATRGSIKIKHVVPSVLRVLLEKLEEAGANICTGPDWVLLDMQNQRPKAVSVETMPYPGFSTDFQAQWSILNAVADGEATIAEQIFDNRFMHVKELKKMAANIKLDGNTIMTKGRSHLTAAEVYATDLRASACLIIAGMLAHGTTIIRDIRHVDRGYELIEEKMVRLGVDLYRKQEPVESF
ncbi:MAG: UDP-N-acetylglucosamine 1-carboxyvinyltransferase [Legionellales bacterium]|nr:UDP-N-acetylglucosamine 1-carboxyvinyltransferase [Legionellales bacterium]